MFDRIARATNLHILAQQGRGFNDQWPRLRDHDRGAGNPRSLGQQLAFSPSRHGTLVLCGSAAWCIRTSCAMASIWVLYVNFNADSVQWIENKDWAYTRTITADRTLLRNEHIDLVFKGLDTFA